MHRVLFAVALVVPNLVFRWKELGITPERLGLVGSIYSASQIVGGMVIGHLGDKRLGRKSTLLLSFIGAGISYTLVGLANSIELLVLSRVIVGLTKQTMTCSTALVTQLSHESNRTEDLGRLSSASTLAFAVGQSVGGVLASAYGRRAPCFLAASLYVFDLFLVQSALPATPPPAAKKPTTTPAARRDGASSAGGWRGWLGRIPIDGYRSAFSGPSGKVLLLQLGYQFAMRGTYSLHALYEKERWELTPARAGLLSSYKMGLGLLVNSVLIGALARRMAERSILNLAILASALNAAAETYLGAILDRGYVSPPTAFALYAALMLPVSSACGAAVRTTLASLFSKAVPVADAGSALGVADVCSSAIGVMGPLYGGLLLGRFGVAHQPAIACTHYVLLLGLAVVLAPRPMQAREKRD